MNKPSPNIPRTLHFVWIGDNKLCPENCIKTWRDNHPDWTVKVWGNDDWEKGDWRNKHHMKQVAATGQLCGVADLLRWEILLNEGGIAIDADSVSMTPLPDWLLTCNLFACWENELERPGLISNGLVGAKPGNPVIAHLVEGLHQRKNIADRFIWYKLKRKRLTAWKTTGPLAFTNAVRETDYNNITILPSHFSIPLHYSGRIYTGDGPVFCSQLYTGTGTAEYKELLQLSPDELRSHIKTSSRVQTTSRVQTNRKSS